MKNVLNNRGPDSFPKMIVAASSSSKLTPILRRFGVEGKFLADGLAVTIPPKPELPSVLRVAVPDETMITDPAGGIIASEFIGHLRDKLKLT